MTQLNLRQLFLALVRICPTQPAKIAGMKTIDLMPAQIRPRCNLKQTPPPSLPINDAIQIKAAEYWLKLGEADEALRELEELHQTWNSPAAIKVRIVALDVLGAI